MDSAERLLKLLALLEGRIDWTAEELASRLAVTPRTVRRDVTRLRSLGYPVEAVAGPGGGYRLGAGGKLPPLLLDDEEALAVALGLQSGDGDGSRRSGSRVSVGAVEAGARPAPETPHPTGGHLRSNGVHREHIRVLRRPWVARCGCLGSTDQTEDALRIRRQTGPGHGAAHRAAPAGSYRASVVPGRLRSRSRRLAHVQVGPPLRALGDRDALGTSTRTGSGRARPEGSRDRGYTPSAPRSGCWPRWTTSPT